MTAHKKNIRKKNFRCYKDNYEHLLDELKKLDLLLQLRVLLFRQKLDAQRDSIAASSMYISDEEIDWLLNQDEFFQDETSEILDVRKQLERLQNNIDANVRNSIEQGVYLALPQLAHFFGLSSFEIEVIVVCLAPELNRKYEKIYAYLQDDITKKKPSIDLVLDLLCESKIDRWKVLTYFTSHVPLFHAGILRKTDEMQSFPGSGDLAQSLKLDPRILNFLLANDAIDKRLIDIIRIDKPSVSLENVFVDGAIKNKLLNLTRNYFSDSIRGQKKLVLHLHGPYGVGKSDLALGICKHLNCSLIHIDAELLIGQDSEAEKLLWLAFRESLLLQTAVYIDNVDVFQLEGARTKSIMKTMTRLVSEYGWHTFLSGEKPLSPKGFFEHTIFHDIELQVPKVSLRIEAWKSALSNLNGCTESNFAEALASRFRLTPGQIKDVVANLGNLFPAQQGQQQLTLTDLFTACRSQSNQNLKETAVKMEPQNSWKDLVLPVEKIALLKEICNQVKHHYRVFHDWGFDQKLTYGKGLSVLFSGPPGTGKTLAAEVIAHELQLDLFKIDLSGVVSKYIGETEKNLAKIFYEAETSNAILFFDEADSLFGKRTSVSDAHDRYANIETSYLLQKMEEYEGIVILATNLRENIDDAFSRRIRFIVEFPFPDKENRFLIWKNHFPKQAPKHEGIDYAYLSEQFQIAGGNIKNIAINSAFLAAENGGIISMEHILAGTKREFEKIGKLWSDKEYEKKQQFKETK
jgi:SpoVK/Ycf46/Vps4 family AAA+-type ATPase